MSAISAIAACSVALGAAAAWGVRAALGGEPARLTRIAWRGAQAFYVALALCAVWALTPLSDRLPAAASGWLSLLLVAAVPGVFAYRLVLGAFDWTAQRALRRRGR